MGKRSQQQINVKRLVAAHRAGNSARELARIFGCNEGTVRALLAQHAATQARPAESSPQMIQVSAALGTRGRNGRAG